MTRCVACGKFMRFEPGVSYSQNWSYAMDGSPDLHDPRFQCRPCTEKHGPLSTNCAHPERYSGVYDESYWRLPTAIKKGTNR